MIKSMLLNEVKKVFKNICVTYSLQFQADLLEAPDRMHACYLALEALPSFSTNVT